MSSIKKYILEQVAKRALSQDDAKTFLTELATAAAAEPVREEEIAIVGMAGRFPMARDAEEFWDVLKRGINCIRDYPESRRKDFEHILRNPHYTEFLIGDAIEPKDIPNAHARAGYLDEIDKFDAAFFGLPPAEATFMDPYQRMALEIAWEAMEDAGYGGKRLFGTNTGVFIGKEGTNYSLYRYCSVKDPMQLTGSWESIMASRISYLFDFRGPCMVVDTACSAGLVSIHMAAQALLSGECDVAIAGGINLSVTGEFNTRFQGGMNMDAVESQDGVIRTFDGRANGTVWGEGAALVMLKPLSRALADRDHIHAVIKGSAINNDGASNGLTAPNAEAQEDVIVKAWRKARIDPAALSYIEAHGTGTVLGDPIEFKGLTGAFRRYTDKRQFCAIGSLKTNMGHLVAASGVASLFKVVKSLEHEAMAPTINFGKPNPYINFVGSPLYVNDTLRPWTSAQGPRIAGISSFGFSHTNCHMIVGDAPQPRVLPAKRPAYCLSLSAHTQAVLLDYVQRFRVFCASSVWNLADLCYTANTGRGHYAHRLAIVASSEGELREQLDASVAAIEQNAQIEGVRYGRHQIVSERKKQRDPGEITDKEKRELSKQAAVELDRFLSGEGRDTARLDELARSYVQGAEIDWDHFYAGEPRSRLALPTYPFQRVRVWAEPKLSKLASVETRLHPLVDRLASRSGEEDIFESVFATDSHWVLSDHKIMGSCVVPGTTYLEMARVAAASSRGWEAIELKDVFFLVPMLVEEGERRHVRIRLQNTGAGLGFHIESLAGTPTEQSWVRHVEGRIEPLSRAAGERVDIEALKAQASEAVLDYRGESDTGVFQFGPHWDAVRAAWRIGTQALARLALPPALQHELNVFRVHPSVLDNAVNLTSQSSGETFLPFTYKSFRLYRAFTAEMYSLIIPKTHKGTGETLTYDVILTDGEGNVLGEIGDYVAKKVKSFAFGGAAAKAEEEFLCMRWKRSDAQEPVRPAEGHLVLIGAGHSESIAALLKGFAALGVPVRHVPLVAAASGATAASDGVPADEDGFARLAASDALRNAAGVVFATDYAAQEPEAARYLAGAGSFALRRHLGVDALFRLTKALLDAKAKLPWGLCVLTREAYGVDGNEARLDPIAAATAALASVVGMEYRHLPCRVVDADSTADGEALARQILQTKIGLPTAWRSGVAYVRELCPQRLEQAEPITIHEDGAYVITGGLGGLGLSAASFLADRGRANVVLVGRSPLPPAAEWEQRALEDDDPVLARRCAALCALAGRLQTLHYIQIDVADEMEVADMLAWVCAEFGRIRGVLHLAGVAGDGFLMRKDFSRFDAVLRPKLEGARNLFALVPNEALDFFVLYSSITALTGGEGQGDYAAANAFMDALAAYGRSAGDKLVAVNWPSWKGVGMAAEFGVQDDETPFRPLDPTEAYSRLERILANGATQIVPSGINPPAFARIQADLPFVLSPELARRIGSGKANAAPGAEPGRAIEVHARGKSVDELSATEAVLLQVYAAVLGLSEIDVFANFQDLGGNSIIATHLLKLIDQQFPGVVDISDVFSYPSIDEMAAYIDEKRLGPAQHAKTDAGAARWEDVVDRVLEGDVSIDAILNEA